MASKTECITIDLPGDIAQLVEDAVRSGEYASRDAVVRDAIIAWTMNRSEAHAALKADISRGLEDIEDGRVHDFNVDRIVDQGRMRLAARSRSA